MMSTISQHLNIFRSAMIGIMVWGGCMLGGWTCAPTLHAPGALWEIRISVRELQRHLSAAFPWEHRVALRDQTILMFTLRHPHLTLPPDTDRIHVRLDADWHFPDLRLGAQWPVLRPGFTTGFVALSGCVRYVPEAGDFYLADLVIHDSHLPGLPTAYDEEARMLLELAANTYIRNMPIYSLRDKGFKEAVGRRVLRSVRIENQEVVVTLGIP